MVQGLKREYRSPMGKLLLFFERSRDNWKAKHHTTKRKLSKTLERLQVARKRRDYWKGLAQAAGVAAPPASDDAEAALKKVVPEQPPGTRGPRRAR